MTRELNARQKQQVADLPEDIRARVETMIETGWFERLTLTEIIDRAESDWQAEVIGNQDTDD